MVTYLTIALMVMCSNPAWLPLVDLLVMKVRAWKK